MVLSQIELLLKETMGLNAISVGSSLISRAVASRIRAVGEHDESTYLALLRKSPEELQELIETVIIPETWFFRDQRPFEALQKYVLQEWLRSKHDGVLKVLSVPCSTGEEPYTIAMALLDIGIPPAMVQIEAVDISAPNIETAQRGIYRDNSFRSKDLTFRDRYFARTDGGYILHSSVRSMVQFDQGNLLDPGFRWGKEIYDIIFCRNVMIYFDSDTQTKAIDTLDRLLRPTGLLFVGHAETGLFLNRWFASARHQMSFAFRKIDDDRRGEKPVLNKTPLIRPSKHTERRKRPYISKEPLPFTDVVPREPEVTPTPVPASDVDLDEAFKLANQGHLVEAADLGEQFLRDEGPSAQVFYLLGVVREATGNRGQAEDYLRKAIYLEPSHVEALTHLALLLDQNGDDAGAANLRRRLDRILDRENGPDAKAAQ